VRGRSVPRANTPTGTGPQIPWGWGALAPFSSNYRAGAPTPKNSSKPDWAVFAYGFNSRILMFRYQQLSL
jgi:hypothetical protein